MKHQPEKYLVPGIVALLVIVYGFLALLSEGTIGEADDISHYYFARYSFRYPHLLVHYWAKPFFTALAAPFAQLGPNGIRIFNVLAGAATAYLTYLTARELKFRDPFLAMFLLISSPLYTVLMLSGMTEILFSLMLISSILLFYRKKYGWAAVILSFMPFVRTEGVVILPLFVIALAMVRNWRFIPLLLVGTIFYSIAGSFHYGDLLWVIHRMPYQGGAGDIYGHGTLLHYVGAAKFIFGIPMVIFILLGWVVWATDRWWIRRLSRREWLMEMVVVYMPFFIYFMAHSYVWWKGLGNSVGLIRVIAAILPSATLLGMVAWNGIMALVPVREQWKRLAALLLAGFLVTLPHRLYEIPVPLGPTQQVMKKASIWLRESPYFDSRIYYYDPYFCHFTRLNPFDEKRVKARIYSTQNAEVNIQDGEIVIWDAHFGPNEGNLPLEKLMDHPGFRLVHLFRPEEPYRVLGGYDYEICIFQRIMEDDGEDNYQIRNHLLQNPNSN